MSRIHRPEILMTELPIIGKIKCGQKLPDKNYPTSLDYFIADSKYKKYFDEAFGEKPSSIEITFHTNDISKSCREFYELRDDQGKLVAEGDGLDFKVWSTKRNKDGEYIHINTVDRPDLMEECLKIHGCSNSRWTENVQLFFIIPKIRGVFGIWEYRSRGSKSSIPQIISTFDKVLEMAGRIAGIPFDLQVKFAKSQKPGSNSRFPVVSIIPNISEAHLNLISEYGESISGVRGLLTENKVEQATKALPETTQISLGNGKRIDVEQESKINFPRCKTCGEKWKTEFEATGVCDCGGQTKIYY